jgi:TonB family protein
VNSTPQHGYSAATTDFPLVGLFPTFSDTYGRRLFGGVVRRRCSSARTRERGHMWTRPHDAQRCLIQPMKAFILKRLGGVVAACVVIFAAAPVIARAVSRAESARSRSVPHDASLAAAAEPQQSSAEGPSRVGGNAKPPRRIRTITPVLPKAAKEAGGHEPVIVEVQIGRDGRVIDARVLRRNPLLEDAALEAVRRWRYTPARVNGKPMPVTMTEVVRFRKN